MESDEVHLWVVKSSEKDDFVAKYITEYPEREPKRSQKSHHPDIILRLILSQYEQRILPDSWVFYKGLYGKPKVYSSTDIFFNKTNQSDMSVIAICKQEIGVDLQRIELNENLFMSICQEFSNRDNMEIEFAKNTIDKFATFYKLWTLKESLAKLYGRPIEEFLRTTFLRNRGKFCEDKLEHYKSNNEANSFTYKLSSSYALAFSTRGIIYPRVTIFRP